MGREVTVFAVINSVGLLGLNAFAVKVEIEASKGLPSFDIVGLADASVKESRERVRSALRSSEITLPLRKIIINLAPADVRKTGSVYDLAVAVAPCEWPTLLMTVCFPPPLLSASFLSAEK